MPPIPKWMDIAAKGVSIVFHPGFQQVYLVVYVAWLQGVLWPVLLPAFVFTFVWPTAFYLWYKKRVLGDTTIYQMRRQDRFWPNFTNLLGLLALAGALRWLGLAEWPVPFDPLALTPFTVTLTVVVLNLLALVVTRFYKISLHMLATGTLVFIFYTPATGPMGVALVLLLCALVGWSRLWLRGHTPDEVLVGAATGLGFGTTVLALTGALELP